MKRKLNRPLNILRKLTKEQADQSVVLYQRGLSLGAIAEYFGVSRQAMWDLLRRRIQLRPQKRHGTENHFNRGGSRASAKASNIVEHALRAGVLVRKESCENCGGKLRHGSDGRSLIHAHHDDYNKPIDVRWLCHQCHHDWHKNNKAVTCA